MVLYLINERGIEAVGLRCQCPSQYREAIFLQGKPIESQRQTTHDLQTEDTTVEGSSE